MFESQAPSHLSLKALSAAIFLLSLPPLGSIEAILQKIISLANFPISHTSEYLEVLSMST